MQLSAGEKVVMLCRVLVRPCVARLEARSSRTCRDCLYQLLGLGRSRSIQLRLPMRGPGSVLQLAALRTLGDSTWFHSLWLRKVFVQGVTGEMVSLAA